MIAALTTLGCAGDDQESSPAAGVIGTPIAAEDIAAPPIEVTVLEGTFGSVYALASAIVDAIEAGDRQRLLEYGLTESEFYWLVWPHLPANRPDVGMPWDFVWRDTYQKGTNSAAFTISRHRGKGYRLIRVDFDGETSAYGPYKVFRDARCVVETPNGETVSLDLFGSVIEMGGRFKAYSLLTD